MNSYDVLLQPILMWVTYVYVCKLVCIGFRGDTS